MDYEKYLNEFVDKLIADPTWDAPDEVKQMLKRDLEWNLIFI